MILKEMMPATNQNKWMVMRPDRKLMNENARKQEFKPGVIYAVIRLYGHMLNLSKTAGGPPVSRPVACSLRSPPAVF